MTKSKYKDKLYDGRWKVIQVKRNKYKLENIYNHQTIEIANETMANIDAGKTTISNIICYRAYGKSSSPNNPYFKKPKCVSRREYAVNHAKE